MKKQIVAWVVTAALITAMPLGAFAAEQLPDAGGTASSIFPGFVPDGMAKAEPAISLTLDGKKQTLSAAPAMVGGTAFIGARDFSALSKEAASSDSQTAANTSTSAASTSNTSAGTSTSGSAGTASGANTSSAGKSTSSSSGATSSTASAVTTTPQVTMEWHDKRKEVTFSGGETVVILKIDSKTAIKNNRVEALPAAVFVSEGSTMVPVKYLSEAFGYGVSWDEANQQLVLTSPVAAASAKPEELLGYNEAIQAGIKESSVYQDALLTLSKAEKQNEDLFLTPGTYDVNSIKSKQSLKLSESWAEKQVALSMDQIGNGIKNQMDSLSLLFTEKKNQEEQVRLMEEKLRVETMKYENGLSSFQSLLDMQTQQKAQVQNLILVEQKISAAYVTLNQTLGKPADYRGVPEYDTAYAPIGAVDIDNKITDDTYSDPYIWLAGQNVDLSQLNLNLYEYYTGAQSWTLSKLDLTQARQDLNNTKTKLAGAIRDRYQSLLQLEDQIRLLEINLDQAKDNVNAVRLQYDLGNAIKLQVEEAQMAIPGIEYNIQSLKQQHSQLKITFEKPYLNPSDYM